MSSQFTNIGQNENAPIATSNNIKQLDKITFGLYDPRKDLKKNHNIVNNYRTRIFAHETNYTIYAFMFNKSFSVIKDSDVVFFDDVVAKMKQALTPLLFEFVETTENIEWLEVFPKFMEFLFFMNTLWVWYDTEEKEFYLLSKVNPENKKDNKYFDLLNHKEVILPTEEPIKCMWDGRDNAHFELWFKTCFKAISREQLMEKMWIVNGKRIKFTVEKGSEIKELAHELLTTDPYVASVDTSAMVEAMESMDPGALDSAIDNHYKIWDREMAELGRLENINRKDERKTTGENMNDNHSVKARQQSVLNQLKLFAFKLKKIKGIELEFKLLNAIDETIGELEEKEAEAGLMKAKTQPTNAKTI